MSTTTVSHPLAACRPLGDRVIVRIDKVSETSPGGIVLPDRLVENSKPQAGVVVAVGPGRKVPLDPSEYDPITQAEPFRRLKMDVEVGDHVLFAVYAGARYDPPNYRGDGYLILREEDVLGVLPGDGEDAAEPA